MIPSQCLMLANRTGMPQSVTTVHRRVSRRMKYRMKSAYGVSPGFIQTTLVINILGMMQGSAVVGALWGLVSSMLFSILRSRFPATRFPSPNTRIFTERNGEELRVRSTISTSAVCPPYVSMTAPHFHRTSHHIITTVTLQPKTRCCWNKATKQH